MTININKKYYDYHIYLNKSRGTYQIFFATDMGCFFEGGASLKVGHDK